MIYFTSDTHFCHNREFLYAPRGFGSIEQMNRTIIDNWNRIVNDDDDVFHLGDVMLNDNDEGMWCLSNLKGKIHIILGNHDTDTRRALYESSPNVVEVCYARPLRYGKYHFFLSHYPTITSNFDYNKPLRKHRINLCGHSHTPNPFADWDKGMIYHVELDAQKNMPVSVDTIILDMLYKCENSTLVKI